MAITLLLYAFTFSVYAYSRVQFGYNTLALKTPLWLVFLIHYRSFCSLHNMTKIFHLFTCVNIIIQSTLAKKIN